MQCLVTQPCRHPTRNARGVLQAKPLPRGLVQVAFSETDGGGRGGSFKAGFSEWGDLHRAGPAARRAKEPIEHLEDEEDRRQSGTMAVAHEPGASGCLNGTRKQRDARSSWHEQKPTSAALTLSSSNISSLVCP